MAVEVNADNFEQEVVEQSHQIPVLVDFWAEWCGPCRMLTPVLEKLEQDFKGRFKLAKVNSDVNREIAANYKVSGIPAVKLIVDGEVRDEFVGALPEGQVKKFLDNNLPDPVLEKIAEQAESSPIEAAELLLTEKVSGEDAYELLWNGAMQILKNGNLAATDQLQKFLNAIPVHGSRYSDGRTTLLKFINNNPETETLQRLPILLNGEGKRDVLDHFLGSVEQAPTNKRDRAKNDLLACFHLLGNQGDLVNEYRRKLSSILF